MKPYRIVVIGRTRSGKTFFVKKWLLKQIPRYIIYDPDKEFGNDFGLVVTDLETINKMLNYDDKVMKSTDYNINKYIKKLKYPRIIFQPTDTTFKQAKKRVEEFNNLCAIINAQRDLFFVVDELSHITLAGDRQRPRLPEEFSLMIKRRMKMGIGIIATVQRLKESDAGFITQSQLIVMFDMIEVDIKYVEDKLGIKIPKKKISLIDDKYVPMDKKEQNLVTVMDVEPYHCWIYNFLTRKMFLERIYEDGSTLTSGGKYVIDNTYKQPKKKIFESWRKN